MSGWKDRRAPAPEVRRATDEQAERLRQRFAAARAMRAKGVRVPAGIDRAASGAAKPGNGIARAITNLRALGMTEEMAREFVAGYHADLNALVGSVWGAMPRRSA